eukprot:scaffold44855_cov18-Tisochrysis_lutea.AAC.1
MELCCDHYCANKAKVEHKRRGKRVPPAKAQGHSRERHRLNGDRGNKSSCAPCVGGDVGHTVSRRQYAFMKVNKGMESDMYTGKVA